MGARGGKGGKGRVSGNCLGASTAKLTKTNCPSDLGTEMCVQEYGGCVDDTSYFYKSSINEELDTMDK